MRGDAAVGHANVGDVSEKVKADEEHADAEEADTKEAEDQTQDDEDSAGDTGLDGEVVGPIAGRGQGAFGFLLDGGSLGHEVEEG